MRGERLALLILLLAILGLSVVTLRAHCEEELRGDVDGDEEVAVEDLECIQKAYGASPGDPFWNPNCDINGSTGVPDNLVSIFDLNKVGKDYGKSRQGTGILFVKLVGASDPVETNAAGNYLVVPGGEYRFNITGITEYTKTKITVWARYKVGGTTYNTNITVHQAPAKTPFNIINFDWTVPSDVPVTTSIKFKYGTDYQGPSTTWVYARKDISPSPRLLLVVPETFLGSLGAIAALFAGLKIKSFVRKRKQHSS
jgi:hypothetical protein